MAGGLAQGLMVRPCRWLRQLLFAGLVAAGVAQAQPAQAQPAQPQPASAPVTPTVGVLRCGWFANPTPANAWLNDRHGEWTVGVQGGHQAEGDWPEFSDARWIKTNGHYGYGCACLRVVADPQTKNVLRIISASSRPIRQCRNDKALKRRPE